MKVQLWLGAGLVFAIGVLVSLGVRYAYRGSGTGLANRPAESQARISDTDVIAEENTLAQSLRIAGNLAIESTMIKPEPQSLTQGLVDEEWVKFPRSRFSASKKVMGQLHNINMAELFRHTELNPRDIYIEPQLRIGLTALLNRYSDIARELQSARGSLSEKELAWLISTGGVEPRSVSEAASRVKARKDPDLEKAREHFAARLGVQQSEITMFTVQDVSSGTPAAMKMIGDQFYSATVEQLPKTSEFVEAEKFIALEAAAMLFYAFNAIDSVSERQRSRVFLERCFKLASTSK